MKGFRYGHLEYFSQKKKKASYNQLWLQKEKARRFGEQCVGLGEGPGSAGWLVLTRRSTAAQGCGSGPGLQVSRESSPREGKARELATGPLLTLEHLPGAMPLGRDRVSDSNLLQAGEVTRPLGARGEDGSQIRGCR